MRFYFLQYGGFLLLNNFLNVHVDLQIAYLDVQHS